MKVEHKEIWRTEVVVTFTEEEARALKHELGDLPASSAKSTLWKALVELFGPL